MRNYRNITLAVDDQIWHNVRVWCAERDISVSRVVGIFLEDLPRLKECRRFPLPDAPHPASLAALFDGLDIEDLALLRRRLRKNSFRSCETVKGTNQLSNPRLAEEALHILTVLSESKAPKK